MILTVGDKTIQEDDFDILMSSENGELICTILVEGAIKVEFTKYDTKRIIDVVATAINVLSGAKTCVTEKEKSC